MDCRPHRKLNVLIADDQPINLRAAVRVLREIGHGGIAVPDGQQALAAMGKHHFDLLLLDVTMPVLDGASALKQIRQGEQAAHKARTPIFMVTGDDLPESTERLLKDGADAVLHKPLTTERLVQALKDLKLY
jgi:protein-histidine pros-kinase